MRVEIINDLYADGFSALQRAEIAEIRRTLARRGGDGSGFSALQRAEIAEIPSRLVCEGLSDLFQCSSTSRNC